MSTTPRSIGEYIDSERSEEEHSELSYRGSSRRSSYAGGKRGVRGGLRMLELEHKRDTCTTSDDAASEQSEEMLLQLSHEASEQSEDLSEQSDNESEEKIDEVSGVLQDDSDEDLTLALTWKRKTKQRYGNKQTFICVHNFCSKFDCVQIS